MSKSIIVPSSPADLKVIHEAVKEAGDCMIRIDSEKQAVKDIVDDLAEKFELPKRFINKMIKTYHKASFDKETSDSDDFAELYEAVTNAR